MLRPIGAKSNGVGNYKVLIILQSFYLQPTRSTIQSVGLLRHIIRLVPLLTRRHGKSRIMLINPQAFRINHEIDLPITATKTQSTVEEDGILQIHLVLLQSCHYDIFGLPKSVSQLNHLLSRSTLS